ncbi:Hsp90 protein-domain-containing protein [Lactarius pseudohatsudake]|nr:Hsp90 protein-domain-containing protein [Lactarius pseudohatsudake]
MSPPHPLATVPPPLPPGWTEHVGPASQIYFFNTLTGDSTYVRPLPALPVSAPKEKPKTKTPIPGTDWLRVTTNQGNVFYTNKAKKESVWTVPDEIKDAVELLNKKEEDDKVQAEKESQEKAQSDAVAEQEREIERIRLEVQQVVKRKAEDVPPSDESIVSKKPRVEDEPEEGEGTDDDQEEDWQREAAAQLAKEAEEEEKRRQQEEAEAAQKAPEGAPQIQMPDRVDLSIEEGKALFKTLLREKDINPLHPWDTSLPLFISDPRYVLLPSVSARREAFDEYCRERARELRASRVKKEKEDPKEEFERLITTEVKSTRTSWSDFRRQWKKDRRFYGWGRDDREREKRFREFLKELGERKRALAQKAEADFFTLLRESGVAQQGAAWKEASRLFVRPVKKAISADPRYDAVGSSSLREELFNTFLTSQSNRTVPDPSEKPVVDIAPVEGVDETQQRKDRKAQAVKEREVKIKAERDRVQTNIEKSRVDLNKEEGELQFRTLLTDAIREPQATWESSLAQLQSDPRFRYSSLSLGHQRHLFQAHVNQLRAKHLDNLQALFLSNAPSLATQFTALPVSSLLSSLPATKMGYDVFKLEQEFDQWQLTRTTGAREAFNDMLSENSFVEFWGRLRKIGGEGTDGGVKRDDDGDEDEGEGGGGNVDMKKLAKNVDITEMEKVLKGDKRYIMFDHVPEQRERWVREYLSRLSAPKFFLVTFRCITTRLFGTLDSLSFPPSAEMRLLSFLVAGIVLGSRVLAQDIDPEVTVEKHHYQSDIARLRNIVINRHVFLSTHLPSLTRHLPVFTRIGWCDHLFFGDTLSLLTSDVFLRELISNANDALEKLRLTSLTNRDVWDGTSPLNITLKTFPAEDGSSGRIVITDNGIGMTPEEMTKNLEFLAQAEGGPESGSSGNLIGAFGLGFYSSFLVADKVYVASVPAKTSDIPNPQQYIFSSSSDDNDFATYPDPRGNTLERGTEITLVLKPDALEYLDHHTIIELINKHSVFSSSFPLRREVPEEPATETESPVSDEEAAETSEDEAVIEEVTESEPKEKKTTLVDHWAHLNAQPPLWTRDAKNISSLEYELFYQATWRDFTSKPLAWNHFSGDLGSGVSFRALLYIPGKLPDEFWQGAQTVTNGIRLLVKRTFITSDLGEDYLPKWASWVRAIIDADDLPLNVSREMLQNASFLRQIKQAILRRIIQSFAKIAEDDPEHFIKIHKIYANVFKLGAIEDSKNSEKLVPLIRFATNQRDNSTLDEYLENKKAGQKQIFYVSDAGKSATSLAKSVFVEKLHARGYEVLLLTDPLDDVLFHHLRKWKGIPFQDAAKAGLTFGDEDLDLEEEKARQAEAKEKFKPLLSWLKEQAQDVVRDVIISDRLVTSPCAVVADVGGYTANVQRIMSATSKGQDNTAMFEFAKRQKVLELNPRSPLIEGLLRRVEQLPGEEEERDIEAEDELREVAAVLIDGALVRSGFEVPDSDEFLIRVDRVLRRSLGVSETAPTDATVKPAPPVDPIILDESEYEPTPEPVVDEPLAFEGKPGLILPDELKDKIQIEMEEIGDDEYPFHDEL